jgi:nucleotide-binding universal stress UspA family protein
MHENILLPVDLADKHSWRKALPIAVSLCESHEARLHVLTVLPPLGLPMIGQFFPAEYEARLRDQVAKQLRDFVAAQVPPGLEVQRLVAHGKVYQQIIAQAIDVDADLIVMAAHHPDQKDYLLGPNADRVVRHAHCSVLIVRE